MGIKVKQDIHQSQGLAITPQLKQAIKLLTLTHFEMSNLIATEMIENPLLEEFENGEGKNEKEKNEDDYKVEKIEGENAEATGQDFRDENHLGDRDDFDFQKYMESYSCHSSSLPPSTKENVDSSDLSQYENTVTKEETLAEHLTAQLGTEHLSEEELEVADFFIHGLNEDGYLDVSVEEAIKQTGHDRKNVERILKTIQLFDPIGCGARNLQECLLVQILAKPIHTPVHQIAERIIRQAFDLLEEKDWPAMADRLGIPLKKIRQAQAMILALNPRPGLTVSSESTQYIVPDIFVRNIGGELKIEVNNEGVPRLRLSRPYQKILKESDDTSTHEYIQDKMRHALWLIKSIHNRQNTIYRVTKAIVQNQPNFFKKGPAFLRPMLLNDVASDLGLHESTISRVTTNKYMHTPLGVFELKSFFGTGIGGGKGGIDIASGPLRLKIKELIEKEDPKKPLSDQAIVNALAAQDVVVARRTITKYRENMGFESSAKRKKKKGRA